MTLEFTVEGAPRGKARPRVTPNGAYTPRKTKDYEELIRWSYRVKYGAGTLTGEIGAAVTAYFPIPASWPKAKKERAAKGEIRPAGKPDADNIAKLVLDSLNGLAYRDDAAIVRLTVEKVYSLYPRVEIILSEVDTDE